MQIRGQGAKITHENHRWGQGSWNSRNGPRGTRTHVWGSPQRCRTHQNALQIMEKRRAIPGTNKMRTKPPQTKKHQRKNNERTIREVWKEHEERTRRTQEAKERTRKGREEQQQRKEEERGRKKKLNKSKRGNERTNGAPRRENGNEMKDTKTQTRRGGKAQDEKKTGGKRHGERRRQEEKT